MDTRHCWLLLGWEESWYVTDGCRGCRKRSEKWEALVDSCGGMFAASRVPELQLPLPRYVGFGGARGPTCTWAYKSHLIFVDAIE